MYAYYWAYSKLLEFRPPRICHWTYQLSYPPI